MGIPRMLTRLKDANIATPKELGRTGRRPHSRAIIDGPGFAHYVLQLLEERPGANHALETDVTYADCASEAVKWLKRMEGFGYDIEALFFDGALPMSKMETRIDRLKGYASKLGAYKATYEETLRTCRIQIHEKGASKIWDVGSLRQARRDVAPSAFLVSAVLEALLESEYADRTFVVPDEADKFCVAAARQLNADSSGLGVAIFANDSDLFVYDSGDKTRIIPLNDLSTYFLGDIEVLTGIQVWPSVTAAQLMCPDLTQLAFHLSDHARQTVGECMVRMVPGEAPTQCEWPTFAASYQLDYQPEILDELRACHTQRNVRNGLDARVSELVHQAKAHDGARTSIELHMFLPFLLEDPTRASAYRVGAGLRSAAYEILLIAMDCRRAVILEYKRSKERINFVKLTDLPFDTLSKRLGECSHLVQGYLDMSTTEGGEEITVVERWRAMVMQLALTAFMGEGWTFPLPEEIVPLLTGQASTQWHMVHLSALYQAAFYSLRILFQIMRYVGRLTHKESKRIQGLDSPNSTFSVLLRKLEGMPNIAAFFGTESAADQSKAHAKWVPMLETMLRTLDEDWQPPQIKKKKKSNKTQTTSGAKDLKGMPSVAEEDEGSLAGNPFAALAAE
ncbi:hypothetical protein LTR36_000728 [Oleoguttula mirabilis]|uniref:Asteroid domain-containing protein n=1 Tax=Oleoguttula mirabilis TaxID=1507867 RepID=A0AAV9JRX4_9PEZI|nr:hypothetical protein LTR36_000728 [Oleoguttula mirabilis]